jgi:hypothetical protein
MRRTGLPCSTSWIEISIGHAGRWAPARHAGGNVSSSFRLTAEVPFWIERQNETAVGKTRGSP